MAAIVIAPASTRDDEPKVSPWNPRNCIFPGGGFSRVHNKWSKITSRDLCVTATGMPQPCPEVGRNMTPGNPPVFYPDSWEHPNAQPGAFGSCGKGQKVGEYGCVHRVEVRVLAQLFVQILHWLQLCLASLGQKPQEGHKLANCIDLWQPNRTIDPLSLPTIAQASCLQSLPFVRSETVV